MRAGLIALIVAIGLAVIGALQAFFITTPTQQALVLQFGEVRQAIREPGLNFKIPFIQDVIFFDKRNLDLNVPAQEIIAEDQKRLVVDAFMRYRIADPVRFYQAVNNVVEGRSRLNTFVQSSLRAVLADATFIQIVREDRPNLMERIRQQVSSRAQDVGVEVVDVRIRRADLPTANSEAIFRRMRTERRQEAEEIRAEGEEAARRIRAAADRTATVLVAEANRESEQIRGEGDGRRSAIFANAYSQDPDFFAFFRAMQAYEQALRSQDTRLVLSPNAEFFRYFNNPMGVARATRTLVEEETGQDLPSVDNGEEAPAASEDAEVSAAPDATGAVEPTPAAAAADEAVGATGDDAAPVEEGSDEAAATDAGDRQASSATGEAVTAGSGSAPAEVAQDGTATAGGADPMEDPTLVEDTDVTDQEEVSVEETLQSGDGSDAIVDVEDRSPVVEPGLDTGEGQSADTRATPSEETGDAAGAPKQAGTAQEETAQEEQASAADGTGGGDAVDLEGSEASTAAAISTAEPAPSEAANRAAAGIAGEEDPSLEQESIDGGAVTVVTPDDENGAGARGNGSGSE